MNRVNDIRNVKRIRHNTSHRRASPRPYRNPAVFGILDKIPDNEKIIDESHRRNRIQLIVQTLAQTVRFLSIALKQALFAKFTQIAVGRVSVGNIKVRQFILTELNFHMTP